MDHVTAPARFTPPAALARAGVAFLAALCSLGTLLVPVARAEEPGPDLRLEWLEDGRAVHDDASAVRGAPGEVVRIEYRLHNVGAVDAFAVVLEPRTALGAAAPVRRLQPGPASGESWDRGLRLVIARGMRQLCIQARLQTVGAEDPQDPDLEDNRVCRAVRAETDSLTHPTTDQPTDAESN